MIQEFENIDIIIPFMNGDDHFRERNLRFIITYYNKYVKNSKIFVVEQDTETDLSKYDYVQHLKIKLNTPFNRSACLNYGVKQGVAKYLILSDNDMIIKHPLLSNIRKHFDNKCVVYPYNTPFIHLTDSETNTFINTGLLLEGTFRSNFTIGGGIILISRKHYYIVGGFDDVFEGWGGEDTAFYYKCKTLLCIKRIKNSLYHLHHISAKRKNDDSINSKLEHIQNMSKTELIKYASEKREYFLKN